MRNYYITGYRHFELGIFSDKDERVSVIRKFLRKIEISLIEEGIDWFLFGGNLGIEYDAFCEAVDLKEEYPDLKLGVIFPFADFGSQWNDRNQLILLDYKEKADFIDYVSKKPYESPSQLKNHTQFLLQHTEGAVLLYEDEHEGKTKFFKQEAERYAEKKPYVIRQLSLEDVQNFLYDSMN